MDMVRRDRALVYLLLKLLLLFVVLVFSVDGAVGGVRSSAYTSGSWLSSILNSILGNKRRRLCTKGSFQFKEDPGIILEGTTQVQLTIERVGGTLGAAFMKYSTSSDDANLPSGAVPATANSDYTVVNNQQVSFSNNEDKKVISIAILNDKYFELNETFAVVLSDVQPQNLDCSPQLGAKAVAIVTIQDDGDVTVNFGKKDFFGFERSAIKVNATASSSADFSADPLLIPFTFSVILTEILVLTPTKLDPFIVNIGTSPWLR